MGPLTLLGFVGAALVKSSRSREAAENQRATEQSSSFKRAITYNNNKIRIHISQDENVRTQNTMEYSPEFRRCKDSLIEKEMVELKRAKNMETEYYISRGESADIQEPVKNHSRFGRDTHSLLTEKKSEGNEGLIQGRNNPITVHFLQTESDNEIQRAIHRLRRAPASASAQQVDHETVDGNERETGNPNNANGNIVLARGRGDILGMERYIRTQRTEAHDHEKEAQNPGENAGNHRVKRNANNEIGSIILRRGRGDVLGLENPFFTDGGNLVAEIKEPVEGNEIYKSNESVHHNSQAQQEYTPRRLIHANISRKDANDVAEAFERSEPMAVRNEREERHKSDYTTDQKPSVDHADTTGRFIYPRRIRIVDIAKDVERTKLTGDGTQMEKRQKNNLSGNDFSRREREDTERRSRRDANDATENFKESKWMVGESKKKKRYKNNETVYNSSRAEREYIQKRYIHDHGFRKDDDASQAVKRSESLAGGNGREKRHTMNDDAIDHNSPVKFADTTGKFTYSSRFRQDAADMAKNIERSTLMADGSQREKRHKNIEPRYHISRREGRDIQGRSTHSHRFKSDDDIDTQDFKEPEWATSGHKKNETGFKIAPTENDSKNNETMHHISRGEHENIRRSFIPVHEFKKDTAKNIDGTDEWMDYGNQREKSGKDNETVDHISRGDGEGYIQGRFIEGFRRAANDFAQVFKRSKSLPAGKEKEKRNSSNEHGYYSPQRELNPNQRLITYPDTFKRNTNNTLQDPIEFEWLSTFDRLVKHKMRLDGTKYYIARTGSQTESTIIQDPGSVRKNITVTDTVSGPFEKEEDNQIRVPRKESSREKHGRKPRKERSREKHGRKPRRETSRDKNRRKPRRETSRDKNRRKTRRETSRDKHRRKPRRETSRDKNRRKPRRETSRDKNRRKPRRETSRDKNRRKPRKETSAVSKLCRKPSKERNKEKQRGKPRREKSEDRHRRKPRSIICEDSLSESESARGSDESYQRGKPRREKSKGKQRRKLDKASAENSLSQSESASGSAESYQRGKLRKWCKGKQRRKLDRVKAENSLSECEIPRASDESYRRRKPSRKKSKDKHGRKVRSEDNESEKQVAIRGKHYQSGELKVMARDMRSGQNLNITAEDYQLGKPLKDNEIRIHFLKDKYGKTVTYTRKPKGAKKTHGMNGEIGIHVSPVRGGEGVITYFKR